MILEPNTQVGRYILQEKIGVGSSGEVWKAYDGNEFVAIKFMHDNLLASKSVEKHRQRLEREINSLKILSHPHIPALHDFDLEYARPYIVMEYVDSPALDTLLFRGELVKKSLGKRIHIIRSIASALSKAHENNIIHRDIKPGNINGVDRPFLMDFSIALAEEDRSKTNFNVGTSIYMAPDFDAPDELGDSWSFAVVAFEILFGRHPIFDYDDPAIKKGMYARFEAKRKLDSGEWFKPGTLGDQIPEDLRKADFAELDAIFTRALGEREGRYTDLNAFAEDIARSVPLGTSLVAEPQPTGEEAPSTTDTSERVSEGEPPKLFTQLEVEDADRKKRILIALGAAIVITVVVFLLVTSGNA